MIGFNSGDARILSFDCSSEISLLNPNKQKISWCYYPHTCGDVIVVERVFISSKSILFRVRVLRCR
jgi:hypothetical protein